MRKRPAVCSPVLRSVPSWRSQIIVWPDPAVRRGRRTLEGRPVSVAGQGGDVSFVVIPVRSAILSRRKSSDRRLAGEVAVTASLHTGHPGE
eukprot:scaffold373126_cov32-Prasinocladus_malaysianus.AAC.1